MTEEEFIEELSQRIYGWLNYYASDEVAAKSYRLILRHIIEGIDPKTTTKDIIFSLEKRLKELENE